MAQEFTLKSIGTYHSPQVHPYEAGRQPDDHHSSGVILLESGQNFEQALSGIEGCAKIWVVFLFHHNNHWNPMVLPPRGGNQKRGVFSTRSPYRPNPVGISCVDLISVEGLKLTVGKADLLDGSPILDIKPYVAYADSFPEVSPTWLESAEKFEVLLSETAKKDLSKLEALGLSQLRGFLQHQLEYEPTNKKKKRVFAQGDSFVIAYRTWRAEFTVDGNKVQIVQIFSGYTEEDLNLDFDQYNDKDLHKIFKSKKLIP